MSRRLFHRLTQLTLFRALKHRPFALVWGGQSVSRFGDSLYTIAVAWWVVEETESAASLGLVLACFSVPQVIFVLLGGLAGDRFSRLYIMLVSDLVRAAAVGTVAVLAWRGDLAIWHLCILSGVFGAVAATFFPAYVASVPDLLPAEDLTSANSMRFMSREAAEIVGPGLGALLIAAGGTPLTFALNSLSFLVAAASVAVVAREPGLHKAIPSERGALHELREGFRTVSGTPWLWISIAVAGLTSLTFSGPVSILPILVKEGRGEGVGSLALLNGLLAVGALIAAVWIGRSHRTKRRGIVAYGAWIIAALMLAVVGLPLPLAVVGIAICIQGIGEGTLNLLWAHTVQEMVPSNRLGRVYSIDALGSYALQPLGFAGAGLAADRFGPEAIVVAGGIISAVIIGAALLHPGVRGID